MRLTLITLLLLSLAHAESGILKITWPTPNPQQQKPSTPYPDVLTSGIRNTKLPVYLPSNYAYDSTMIVVAEENFYSVDFLLKEATLTVGGDRTFQESVSTNDPKFKAIAKSKPTVEFYESEGIMTAEFNRHGANYFMSVECDQPNVDLRCKDDSFLKNLYNHLIMVGGQQ